MKNTMLRNSLKNLSLIHSRLQIELFKLFEKEDTRTFTLNPSPKPSAHTRLTQQQPDGWPAHRPARQTFSH